MLYCVTIISSSNCSNHTPSSHSTLLLWTAFSLSISLHCFLCPLSSFVRWLFFVSPLCLSLPLSLSLSPPPECGCGLIRKCVAQNTQSITLPKLSTPAHALADTYIQTHTHTHIHPLPSSPFPLCFLSSETLKLFSFPRDHHHLLSAPLSLLSFTTPCPLNPALFLFLVFWPSPSTPLSHQHPQMLVLKSCPQRVVVMTVVVVGGS